MTEMVPLSVAIITKNEEKRLPGCLKSIDISNDIVVVDSGSNDKTVEIAQQFGCRVYVEDWKGDGPQKNSAIDKCNNEWVLVLDADERLTDEAKNDIIFIVKSNNPADAYSFKRKSIFHNKWIHRCGWWPDRVTRLFKKSKGRYHAITHGNWVTTGQESYLNSCLLHYSFYDYSDMLKRLDAYSNFRAQELYEEGKRASCFSAIMHGVSMFIKSYIVHGGIFEGLDGLVISLIKSGGSFFKYAKLVELTRYGRIR